jgi:hypothetical protein
MVQLRRGEASFKLAAGHDDGFDLCLTQARFVVIGLEECARAAARHSSSRKIKGVRCSLWLSVDRARGEGLCSFVDTDANPIAFARALGHQAGRCSVVEGDSPNSER